MDFKEDYDAEITEDEKFIKPFEKASIENNKDSEVEFCMHSDMNLQMEIDVEIESGKAAEIEAEDRMKLARAHVPFQKTCHTYHPTEGLIKGTIFPALYLPYHD